jgi:hypothetical protein
MPIQALPKIIALQKMDNNIIAQANQNDEITKQKIALALLVNTTKA